MTKITTFLLFFFIYNYLYAIEINVASTNIDNIGSNNQKTLLGAYNRLLTLFPSKVVNQVVNINIQDNIRLAESPQNIVCLIWDISGTSAYNITFKSGTDSYNEVKRPIYDNSKQSYLIELRNVNFVHFSKLKFPEATVGIFINSSDYCSIKDCQFIGNPILADGGSGVITISRFPFSLDLAKFNDVTNNYIKQDGSSTIIGDYGTSPGYSLHHAIYIAEAEYNEIQYNTIINPPGYGIHYWHGFSQNNIVRYNVINICDDGNSKGGIILGYGDCDDPSCSSSNVFGNSNINNYIIYSNESPINSKVYYFPNGCRDLQINKSLTSNNSISPNYLNRANINANRYGIDPYWVYYNAESVTNKMINGDFDNDGFSDDVAALYDYGGQHTQIHLWLNKKVQNIDKNYFEQESSFQYLGNVWNSNGFDASKASERLVSGDFDGNGYTDIACLYDYGNSTSKLLVWLSNGTSFAPANYAFTWWSSSSGAYDASKVTGRLVSGDFNNDGKDDIASMYDYGSNNSRIHVWLSTGNAFNSPSTNWISNPNSYNANSITGRLVCGDFNNDNLDDIAGMYDYGISGAAIHVWLSNGNNFTPNGYALTFWTTNGINSYNANKVTNKIVSGDFNNDGKDDITAMYDYGFGNSRLHCWISNGSGFNAPETRWISNSNSYNSNLVSGRLLSGDYNNDGKSDILGMFDYSNNNNFKRSRFHVWETEANQLQLQNESLGYPWMNYSSNIEMTCNNTKSLINSSNAQDDNPSEIQISDLKIYPNPSNENLIIESPLLLDNLIISNCLGITVFESKLTMPLNVISISDFQPGIYIVRAYNKDYSLNKTFIKQ